MLLQIILFEIKYRVKRIETYAYLLLILFTSMVSVDLIYEGQLNNIAANAPKAIAAVMSIMSAFYMIITSMIAGTGIMRDYQYNIASLIFTCPIHKRDYFFGRFIGGFIVTISIFSTMMIGSWLGMMLPWRDASIMLDFHTWHYLQPFIYIVLPTLFFGSALFFIGGTLSRKLIVVYVQGILLIAVYILSLIVSQQYEDNQWSSLLDLFGFQTIKEITQYWTPKENNTQLIPIIGPLLINRTLWVIIGMIILYLGYRRFDYSVIQDQRQSNTKDDDARLLKYPKSTLVSIPKYRTYNDNKSTLQQLLHSSAFYFKTIIREPSFWALITAAMAIIIINSISLGTTFGVDSYPITYLVIEELEELSIFFFLVIMIFYTGEIIWQERDNRFYLMADAIPTQGIIILTSKLIALTLTYVTLLSCTILAGVIFQLCHGFYDLQLDIYIMASFVGILPTLTLYTVAGIFFHVISNNKYVAHVLLIILFIIMNVLQALGLEHPLYTLGAGSPDPYSEMNGYGHSLTPYLWFMSYWHLLLTFIFIISSLFYFRGVDRSWSSRLIHAQRQLSTSIKWAILIVTFPLILIGGYIFYNINILNQFTFPSYEEEFRADYEKNLKRYEYIVQPKIIAIDLNVDLHPSDRGYNAKGNFTLKNESDTTISTLHVQHFLHSDATVEAINLNKSTIIDSTYGQYGYYIHNLIEALVPGDSIVLTFIQNILPKGFQQHSHHDIVYNGTFFRENQFPTIGYNSKIELESTELRNKYKLPLKTHYAPIDHPIELQNSRRGDDGHHTRFEIIVSTEKDQTAVAPGRLINSWTTDNRAYFHYKMKKPITNFYPIVSARYEVATETWIPPHNDLGAPVLLEIYHHPHHKYNVKRMMLAMHSSLDYYSTAFSPYQYDHLRIMEFPRYQSYAQSLPATIPFSESLGFILDIDDTKDVDMVFFVTAHEVAHQWWGHQLVAANVEGRHFILESLAQYSALMALKQAYPTEKVEATLQREMKRYLSGRSMDMKEEKPLARVNSQEHIHYGKGAINLYTLQEYIGEKKMNDALRNFLQDWNHIDGQLQQDRLPTTDDLICYLRDATPDSLQYLITDLFERIIIHDNQVLNSTYSSDKDGIYQVTANLRSIKYNLDKDGNETIITDKRDYINIAIYAKGKNDEEELIYLKRHQFMTHEDVLEVKVKKEPSRISIDPNQRFIDRDAADNTYHF